MSTDYTKVYLFLNTFKDLQDLDSNGDGTIIKAEFQRAMYGQNAGNGNRSYSDFDTTLNGAQVKDLIDNFWDSFDTKISGKVDNTKIREQNALNETEEANLTKQVQYYGKISELYDKLEEKLALEVPEVFEGTKYQEAWKNSVLSAAFGLLSDYAINNDGKATYDKFINAKKAEQSGIGEKLIKDFLSAKSGEITDIQNLFTATCFSELFIDDEFGEILKEQAEGYDYREDEVLTSILANYFKNLETFSETKPDEIIESLKVLLARYFNTAELTTLNGYHNGTPTSYIAATGNMTPEQLRESWGSTTGTPIEWEEPSGINSKLATYGYNDKSWSPLQNSAITTLIYDRLEIETDENGNSLLSLISAYEATFAREIQIWISDKVAEGLTFAQIKELVLSDEFLEILKDIIEDAKNSSTSGEIIQVETPEGGVEGDVDLIESLSWNNIAKNSGNGGTYPDGRDWMNAGYTNYLHVGMPEDYTYADVDITTESKYGAQVDFYNGHPNGSVSGDFMGWFSYRPKDLGYPYRDIITVTVKSKDGKYTTTKTISIMVETNTKKEDPLDPTNNTGVVTTWGTWEPGKASPWWNSDRDPRIVTNGTNKWSDVMSFKLTGFDD